MFVQFWAVGMRNWMTGVYVCAEAQIAACEAFERAWFDGLTRLSDHASSSAPAVSRQRLEGGAVLLSPEKWGRP